MPIDFGKDAATDAAWVGTRPYGRMIAQSNGKNVSHKNILVPLARDSRDLKALHHAVSLTGRIESRLFVLFLDRNKGRANENSAVMEACLDVIRMSRENGQGISFFTASDNSDSEEEEFLKLLEREGIDLIILSDTETRVKKMIQKTMQRISCQIIQVGKKDDINYLA